MTLNITSEAMEQLARLRTSKDHASFQRLIFQYIASLQEDYTPWRSSELQSRSRGVFRAFASTEAVEMLAQLGRDSYVVPRVTSLVARSGSDALVLLLLLFEAGGTLTIAYVEGIRVPFQTLDRRLREPRQLEKKLYHFASAEALPASTGSSKPRDRSKQTKAAQEPPYHEVRVWYGTNRKPRPVDETAAATPAVMTQSRFGPERDNVTHLGQCFVSVRADRPKGGMNWSILRKLVGIKGDDVAFTRDEELDADVFWDELAIAIRDKTDGNQSALIFVHGFCNTFESAAETAAVVSVDACRGKSAVAMFSWPSHGDTESYVADLDRSEQSIGAFEAFLTDFAARSGARKLHILAHSMGARLVMQTLSQMQLPTAALPPSVDNLILAAPDVDSFVLISLNSKVRIPVARKTLYASRRDNALKASRFVHRDPRAGLAPPLTVAPDVDTVDASAVDFSGNGHRSLREAPAVLDDMFLLTRHGHAPNDRGLDKGPIVENIQTWVFRPERTKT